jgi:hypothetical protein
MAMGDEMQRQAVRHGVADAMTGITRLPIVDDVYDEQYWADYQAGATAWREAEQCPQRPQGNRPSPALRQGTPDGQQHPDLTLAGRGWQTSREMYVRPAPEQPGRPFAVVMLDHLRENGDWTPRGQTVAQARQSAALAELARQWAAEPPEVPGLDADGPEAG